MMKISENVLSDERTMLRLEGQMIGQGVVEVRQLCERCLAAGRKLTLDLDDLMFVDRNGIGLLQDLLRRQVTLANCSLFLIEQLKEPISSEPVKKGPVKKLLHDDRRF